MPNAGMKPTSWPPSPAAAGRQPSTRRCAITSRLRRVRGVLQVAEAMAALEQETLADTRLPSAGQVWWRAQVRARHDAAAVAARPVMVAQALGGAAALGLVAAVVSWQWAAIATAAFDLGLIAWVGVATAAVLGPLAIYAAVRE